MTIPPRILNGTSSGSRHLLIFVYEAWGKFASIIEDVCSELNLVLDLGHARALCNFAARFVKATGVPVTYITTEGILERLNLEIARSFTPEEAHLQKLIRYGRPVVIQS